MKRFRLFCKTCQGYTPPIVEKDASKRVKFLCWNCGGSMLRVEYKREVVFRGKFGQEIARVVS